MAEKISRRDFFRIASSGIFASSLFHTLGKLDAAASPNQTTTIPKRPLGKTGFEVGLFSLGGQATLEERGRWDDAVAIINRALDLGVNYCDTAPYYGPSQDYFGEVMETRRNEVFLATKTHRRSYDGSMRLLEESLRRLHTDKIDVWQLHAVRTQSDLDAIFAEDGAIKAMEKARSEGLVRFLGITGHSDPFVLARAIRQYPFDCILLSLNAADRHRSSFIDHLLPVAVEQKMGIIGMKIPARGRIFRKDGIQTMEQAMRYVLTLPVSTVVVGCDNIAQLEENVRIAKEFSPLSEQELKKLEELTKPYYADATWFKTEW